MENNTKFTQSNDKFNIFDHITQKVISGLETSGMDWFKTWQGGANNPINHKYGNEYGGFNVFWLNIVCQEEEYEHNEWLTYKQGKDMGYTLKKGSKAGDQFVIFWQVSYLYDGKWYSESQLKKAGIKKSDTERTHWNPRYYNVFNIAQFEQDIEPRRKPIAPDSEFNPVEEAEKVLRNYKKRPTLKHGGNQAFYRPADHHVQMPKRTAFVTPDDYYKTLFHELTHSTGHKDLLNRKGIAEVNRSNKEQYSKEELIAELGALYLVGNAGLTPKDDVSNSTKYIKGWIKHLKESDNKEILYASQASMKAVNFILNK